jgi:hypothetical protein
MQSATILAEGNTPLRVSTQRQGQKRQQCRHYIAQGGVLQAQERRMLITGAGKGVCESDQTVPTRGAYTGTTNVH